MRVSIEVEKEVRTNGVVIVWCNNGLYFDEGYEDWEEGLFANVSHAEKFIKDVLATKAGTDYTFTIRPYIRKGTMDELYEVLYNKRTKTVQLFDIGRQPIWIGGDNKLNMSLEVLHVLLCLLKTFGHNFQPLWDVDSRECWVHTRVYEDGREKYINNRYYDL